MDVYAFGVVTLYMIASVCPSVGVDYFGELSKAKDVCPEERCVVVSVWLCRFSIIIIIIISMSKTLNIIFCRRR